MAEGESPEKQKGQVQNQYLASPEKQGSRPTSAFTPSKGEGDLEEKDWQNFKVRVIYPKPYKSETFDQTVEEVKNFLPKNTRPLVKLRITRKRKEFGQPTQKFTEQDQSIPTDCKMSKDPNFQDKNYRKILDMGVQAGEKVITQKFQTSFNRKINSSSTYKIEDYVHKQVIQKPQEELYTSIEAFLETVQKSVEDALQSNETVNVFQDEFSLLGDEEGGDSKISTQLQEIADFNDHNRSKNRIVSDIQ